MLHKHRKKDPQSEDRSKSNYRHYYYIPTYQLKSHNLVAKL